jgi:hypothetical protein
VRSVERVQRKIEFGLILGFEPDDCRSNLTVDRLDGLLDTLATPSALIASCAPVEAPDGTAARPMLPSSRVTSTSTVGLPRLSRIWRAWTSTIAVMLILLSET